MPSFPAAPNQTSATRRPATELDRAQGQPPSALRSRLESVSDPEARAERQKQDARIVSALCRGDARAAAKFYERVEHVVTGALLQILGPGDRDHEDLAQLALERVLESVLNGKYRGRCNLGTWASVVATRVAIDALRRRRHERRIFARNEEEEPVDGIAPEVASPDRQVESQRKLEALRDALAKISPEKAETVVLFEVMGQDLTEIAEQMGVSVAAAQTRLVRGRRELRAILARRLGDPDVG